ncbi:MAG: hypothetical protein AMXMBFR61_27330 [Fimbriimonadales bacterium]
MEAGLRVYRVEGAGPGDRHMADDADALDAASRGVCTARIYQWDGPWVSLGMSQKPEEALDLEACARLGVRWVVRPTGGRAVLHGADVTFSLACPLAEVGGGPRNVRAAYRALAPLIVEALARAGARATLGERSRSLGPSNYRGVDCFRSLSANDVADAESGAKLAGTALRICGDSVLLQASIPTGPYLVPPEEIYLGAAAKARPTAYPDADGVIRGLSAVLEERGYRRTRP